MKPGRAGTMTHDYKRHGTTTLFAALNILDGTVIGRNMQRHRHHKRGKQVLELNPLEYSMIWKSLELLRQIAPSVHQLAIMFNPTTAPHYNVLSGPKFRRRLIRLQSRQSLNRRWGPLSPREPG